MIRAPHVLDAAPLLQRNGLDAGQLLVGFDRVFEVSRCRGSGERGLVPCFGCVDCIPAGELDEDVTDLPTWR